MRHIYGCRIDINQDAHAYVKHRYPVFSVNRPLFQELRKRSLSKRGTGTYLVSNTSSVSTVQLENNFFSMSQRLAH
jgi:hypothetical protein